MSDTERAEIIDIGIKAGQFENSVIGQYLLNRAAKEAHEALMQFKTVGTEDVKTIGKLQLIIKRHDDLERWIKDAILEGNNEYQNYLSELEGGNEL